MTKYGPCDNNKKSIKQEKNEPEDNALSRLLKILNLSKKLNL